MQIRYSTNQKDFKRYTTKEIRDEFLIEDLYQKNQVVAVYSHVDRMVTLGCMPVAKKIALEQGIDIWSTFGTQYFLERREIGIFNLGEEGKIHVGDKCYVMGFKDCLYIAMGNKEIYFESNDSRTPARFYMVSAPAHRAYETKQIRREEATKKVLGSVEGSNERVINQYIHPDVLQTCQLVMGITELKVGNVWNTIPCHTHERRMEVYTYFEMDKDNRVFHYMGEADETRHVVMKNYDAIISPSWSIHAGCGTSAYSFIWAMGGENQAFDDMDTIYIGDVK